MGSPHLTSRTLAVMLGAALSTMLVGIASVVVVAVLVHANDEGQTLQQERLVDTALLASTAEQMTACARGYLLMSEVRSRSRLTSAQHAFRDRLAHLRTRVASEEEQSLLSSVELAETEYAHALDEAVAEKDRSGFARATTKLEEAQPLRESLSREVGAFRALQDEQWDIAEQLATARIHTRILWLSLITALAFAVSGLLALLLHKTYRALSAAREVLQANVARLEVVNRDLDAFAGRIAHDIRSSLGPLSLSVQMLSRYQSSDIVVPCAMRMKRSLDRTESLLEGLLEFSRAGRPSGHSQTASLCEAIDDAIEEGARAAQEAGVEISRQTQQVDVAVDMPLLRIVVGNLVNNAVKFMRASSRERRVVIRSSRLEKWAELVVEDTGPGIPPGDLGHIFEPFFRGRGVGQPGTGIGLATVHRIVESHGGTISIESTVGTGTLFRIQLPIAPPADSENTAVTGSAPKAGSPIERERETSRHLRVTPPGRLP